MQAALWILSLLLMAAGLAGTVLPALPGIVLVFAGIVLGAWIDDFTRISVWTVVICGLLTLAAWAIDYLAALVGAKRAGASGLALLGAAVGTVLGIFGGLIGLLFLPLAGAAIGQFLSEGNARRAASVGLATWIGLMLGTIAKVVIACLMIGLFALALAF
ncbi:MAG: hypothetical protein RLZ51_588 [Pseudomonadota bacterium]|jgi:uncharacterized protein YqgC (DUF456 family)